MSMPSLRVVVVILPWMAKADDQTQVTSDLNNMISTSSDGCVYRGGKGVVVRNPFDGMQDNEDKSVVPASFWVNDLIAPSGIYPDYDWDEPAGLKGAAYRASVAFVIGNNLGSVLPDIENVQNDDWGWGVFYATDSNAADMRCRYRYDDNGFDCPGAWIEGWESGDLTWDDGTVPHLGTGIYAFGNPYAGGGGGGTGAHWSGHDIDQATFPDGNGVALTMDSDAQCNYDLKGNGWADWVNHWITNDPPSEWMSTVDQVACWVNNIRDLINLQNNMFWIYGSEVTPGTSPVEYWGWNEIPLDRLALGDPLNWDAVVIHLPAEIGGPGGASDSVWSLDINSQWRLEGTLDKWVQAGYLVPGVENMAYRPGSYVVFVREFQSDDGTGNWYKWFFCEPWTSPGGLYEIVSWSWGDDSGGCVIQYAASANIGNNYKVVTATDMVV